MSIYDPGADLLLSIQQSRDEGDGFRPALGVRTVVAVYRNKGTELAYESGSPADVFSASGFFEKDPDGWGRVDAQLAPPPVPRSGRSRSGSTASGSAASGHAHRPEILADVVARVDPNQVAERMVAVFRAEITGYRRLPEPVVINQILAICRDNVELFFGSITDGQAPTEADLARFRESARDRAGRGHAAGGPAARLPAGRADGLAGRWWTPRTTTSGRTCWRARSG